MKGSSEDVYTHFWFIRYIPESGIPVWFGNSKRNQPKLSREFHILLTSAMYEGFSS